MTSSFFVFLRSFNFSCYDYFGEGAKRGNGQALKMKNESWFFKTKNSATATIFSAVSRDCFSAQPFYYSRYFYSYCLQSLASISSGTLCTKTGVCDGSHDDSTAPISSTYSWMPSFCNRIGIVRSLLSQSYILRSDRASACIEIGIETTTFRGTENGDLVGQTQRESGTAGGSL